MLWLPVYPKVPAVLIKQQVSDHLLESVAGGRVLHANSRKTSLTPSAYLGVYESAGLRLTSVLVRLLKVL